MITAGAKRQELRLVRVWGQAILWVIVLGARPAVVRAEGNGTGQPAGQDLTATSIEDLMNIQVTSVSKTEQKLSQTAAAIFVISQDDIRRSGATNIPDLLRMVPGVDVAQINSNAWAIGVRGLNGRFDNNLLVLVDGHSVYTPTFGGVFWDALDMPLEDIERIEVIRGPGGSVWGANAMNGVINIITTAAGESHGGMVVAGGGNVEQGFATMQYGGNVGKATDYRVFMKYTNPSELPGTNGQSGNDDWEMLRGGFRTDTTLSQKDRLTLEGDVYGAHEDQMEPLLPAITASGPVPFIERMSNTGGYFQTTWNHTYSSRSDMSLSASYDQYIRPDVLDDRRKTLDINFQHHFRRARQEIVWGADERYSIDRTGGSLFIMLDPEDLNTNLFGAFVEDKITVVSNRLYLIAGVKGEHNYYTGWAGMPSGRVLWTPSARHTLWAAASEAVTTPDGDTAALRVNNGGFTPPGGLPVLFSLYGNSDLADEHLLAYEAGYRSSFGNRFSVDLATYYNRYTSMQTQEPGGEFLASTPAPLHTEVPTIYENLMYGEAHGFELFGNWKIFERWTISPGYAFEQIHMHLDPTSQDTTSVGAAQGSSPVNSVQLRSHVTLLNRLSWDTSAYFTGRLSDLGVPSYGRLDTGFSWQWTERFAVSAFGQNLLKSEHLEFVDLTQSTESNFITRGGYVKLIWFF